MLWYQQIVLWYCLQNFYSVFLRFYFNLTYFSIPTLVLLLLSFWNFSVKFLIIGSGTKYDSKLILSTVRIYQNSCRITSSFLLLYEFCFMVQLKLYIHLYHRTIQITKDLLSIKANGFDHNNRFANNYQPSWYICETMFTRSYWNIKRQLRIPWSSAGLMTRYKIQSHRFYTTKRI